MRFPFEQRILSHLLGPVGLECREMFEHLAPETRDAFFLAIYRAKPHVAALEGTPGPGRAKMDAATQSVLQELEQAGLQLAVVLVQLAVQLAVAYLRAQGGAL